MFELINSNVVDMNGECTSSSDTRCDTESLHAASIVGIRPSHPECNLSDAREIPLSEDGLNGTSLKVGIAIIGKKPKHSGQGSHNAREVVRLNPLGEVL